MHLSLRGKLILVMSLVVAGATIGTAVVSQGVVRKAYEDKFESDFKAEVRYFSQRQMERMESMKKKCEDLATSDTFVAAVQKREPNAIKPVVVNGLKEFYETQGAGGASGLARTPILEMMKPPGSKGGKGGEPPPRPGFGSVLAGKLGKAAFAAVDRPTVAVVDNEGEIICMVDPEGRLMSAEETRIAFSKGRPEKQRDGASEKREKGAAESYKLRFKRLAAHVDDEQKVAYVTWPGPDGRELLRSAIVTPVLAKGSTSPVGAVILSVLTSDLGERELHRFSQETDNETATSEGKEEGISSGFWLEGKLHTKTIPESARDIVSQVVAERVESAKTNAKFHEANITLDEKGEKVPHKLIFRVLNPDKDKDSPFPPACQVALYSLRDEIGEERNVQQKISTIGLLALAFALGCILLLSRSLTRPIRDLVKGTEQIRAGNFDVVVNADRRDELGQLATSFNEMTQGLKMNQKYQRLLSQFADRMVADQLINNESALGGELREVTVLFCDIRGFTKLTSGMPPGEVIAMLNEHMTALTGLVHDHFGVVDKFVGDMVMALFGAPSANGDDAERAALCALRMIQVREELNHTGNWHVNMGIGIATGTVVAGCMGSEARMDYTVLGERVNLASRLCDEALPGEVLIDETTRAKLGALAETQLLPNLELKGFDSAVTAYRLSTVHANAAERAFGSTALLQMDA